MHLNVVYVSCLNNVSILCVDDRIFIPLLRLGIQGSPLNIKHYLVPWPSLPIRDTDVLRRSGLMVSVLVPRLSSPCLSPGWGHRAVFLG